jgi:putative peptidoglycan lipid II flippase
MSDFEDLDIPEPVLDSEPPVDADHHAGRRMALGALVISFFLSLGKISGYAKSMLIAKWFGGSAVADAYYSVYNVLIYATYSNIEKILRPTLLPQFVRQMRSRDEQSAWRLLSVVANLELLVMLVICAVAEVFAPQIVRLLWKQLASNPVGFSAAVALLRVMAPTMLFLSLSLLPELTLHAYKRFSLPAFAEFCYRTALVLGMVFGVLYIWSPSDPRAILAAALGVVLGGLLRFLIMLPGLSKQLRHYRLLLDPRSAEGVSTVLSLIPPVLIGMGAAALRGIADSVFADRIGREGMYTYLTWGRQMGDSSLQILPLAVSFVVYPFLSEWAAKNDRDKLAEALVGMTRVMAFIFVPVSVAIMFMARPIITIMFEHGKVNSQGASLAALALFCYSPGLVFFALEGSINKWYFALQDTKTPNYWGAAMAALHVLIGYVGVMVLRPRGLITEAGALAFVALALSLSKSLKVIILYGLLRKRIGAIDRQKVLSFTLRLGLATALMGVVIYLIGMVSAHPLSAWNPPFMAHNMRMLVLAAAVGLGGGSVFLVAAALLRLEELGMIWTYVSQKVRRRLEH